MDAEIDGGARPRMRKNENRSATQEPRERRDATAESEKPLSRPAHRSGTRYAQGRALVAGRYLLSRLDRLQGDRHGRGREVHRPLLAQPRARR